MSFQIIYLIKSPKNIKHAEYISKKTKKKKTKKKNKTVMTLWLAGSIIKNFRNIACKYVNYKCMLNENTWNGQNFRIIFMSEPVLCHCLTE